MKIQVQLLDHVTLIVSDLERSREFYVDFLGMEQVTRPDFDFPGLWFQAGPTTIHLTLEDEKAGKAGWGNYQGATSLPRSHHFAFLVDDVEEVVPLVESSGYQVISPMKRRPDGAKQLFISDPDGHVVELASEC